MPTSRTATILLVAGMSALATTTEATAAEIVKSRISQAVAACQAALPAYDGLIRKRPKAVANEGTAAAFVTCSPPYNPGQREKVELVTLVVANRNAVTTQINCTLVDGLHDATFIPSVAKSRNVAPASKLNIEWAYMVDAGSTRYTMPAISCALPPGTEIVSLSTFSLDEVAD